MIKALSSCLRPSEAKALLIDGKAIAQEITEEVREQTRGFAARFARPPGLAVILVGEDPASQVYVRNKSRMANMCGLHSIQHNLPIETTELELLRLVEGLNQDPMINGILVQLPLPSHIRSGHVLEQIAPSKDVDGFHYENVGRLARGDVDQALIPCTPAGCLHVLKRVAAETKISLAGMEALIIGRSNIVGKPLIPLLLKEDCTVTIAHSRSKNLPHLVSRADIVIAAVGQPEMIRGEWFKLGAIVIDVGINRVQEDIAPAGPSHAKTRLVGDVDFTQAIERVHAITPVPGGIGPMTIAMLMRNTLVAAMRHQG